MASKDGFLQIKIVGDSKPLEKTLKGLPGKVAKFGVASVAALGAAVVGFGAFSIKTFADFDQAMTNSTAIMGDLSNAMRDDMSSAAREVAKTTKFSAVEAADSFFFLASAGLDAAASIEALPRVAAFAQAGNFDMAVATDLLTDAQSALGLVVDDTAGNLENMVRVSDVLVKANTLANASVEQFSEALTQKAGNALRNLNKDVEEGVAVLSVYADAGIKGSQAGVLLNSVLEGLTRTARTNTEDYAALGVSVFDSSGEMRNMADIVGDLEGALDGMSTEQQTATLASLGLTRTALDGTIALLGNSEAIRGYESDLRSAGGATDEVSNKQMQTFWAKLGIVKDQLLDVALSIGMALMPALEQFTDWLSAKLPDITAWFDNVASKFNELMGVSQEAMGGANIAVDSFKGGVESAAMGVTRDLDGLAAPIGRFEDKVSLGMTAAGVDITRFSDEAEEEFDEAGTFMERLSEAWQTVWNEDIKPWLLGTALPWLENVFFPKLIDAFANAGRNAGTALGSELGDAFNAYIRTWNPVGIARRVIDATSGVPPILNQPPSQGRNAGPRFHDGGVIPGRPGQEVPILAMAGETVLPTHKAGYSGGVNINGPVYVTSNNAVDLVGQLQQMARAS